MEPTQSQKELEPIYKPDTAAHSAAFQFYSWLQPVLFALTVLVIVSTFFGRLIGVDGDSMFPTLHNHDMLILRSIGYTPKNGDVVVLAPPTFRNGTPIVKRVIATGGQKVNIIYDTEMDEVTGQQRTVATVEVDGQALDEKYLGETMRLTADQFYGQYPITVPEGHFFVLGDNRNESSDSRYPDIGMADERCVLGKAVWILFPFQRFGGIAR